MNGEDESSLEPDARAFETFVRARFHETDALGHLNNAVYLNYLEQAAIDHAACVGLDVNRLRELGGMFVARRHDVTFLRPAFAGDTLRILTWLSAPKGARIVRSYRIFRELNPPDDIPTFGRFREATPDDAAKELVVKATTEWVFANEHGAPRRIPNEVDELFGSRPMR